MSDQELKGTKCPFFEDRDLEVKVSLNKELDFSENYAHKEPTLVKLDQEGENTWYFDYVVFLYEGSYISFTIRSNGPCGYGFKIFTTENSIVNRYYAVNKGDEKKEGKLEVTVDAYQYGQDPIRVRDFQYLDNQINSNVLRNHLVNIVTWPIYGYEKDNYKYRPGLSPVRLRNSNSQQQSTIISNIIEDRDKLNLITNGSIHMFFYVLKEGEDIKDICEF
ncbi:MAG: hypothetical protein F6K23_02635 [Okeania sp. SIO2C9]|uniref:hypothetical protein n=1 Tax=Okeania sp. SIO2C9 TaxID=2607791 RepID=UPI0013C19257|nr:hypothetical protein [Okeania sp. SIO2C9]NEQ72069.1 hypothetical protein [Okeania sp. SIO2C9]